MNAYVVFQKPKLIKLMVLKRFIKTGDAHWK